MSWVLILGGYILIALLIFTAGLLFLPKLTGYIDIEDEDDVLTIATISILWLLVLIPVVIAAPFVIVYAIIRRFIGTE